MVSVHFYFIVYIFVDVQLFFMGSFFHDIVCLSIIILLAGDVELNPGPYSQRAKCCRILYANIRGLYKNIKDLTMAAANHDIVLCLA